MDWDSKVETFIELKELAGNPHYQKQRQDSLRNLTYDMIDKPIINLINGEIACFNRKSSQFNCHPWIGVPISWTWRINQEKFEPFNRSGLLHLPIKIPWIPH